MSMAEAQALVRAFVGAMASVVDRRWGKVVALGILGLLFTGFSTVAALSYLWLPGIATFSVALTIGMMVLAGISYLACIINICILE